MKLQKFPRGLTHQWSLGADINEFREFIHSAQTENRLDLVVLNVLAGISEPIDPFMRVTGDEPLFASAFEMYTAASPDLLLVGALLKTSQRRTPQIDWLEMDKTPEAVKFQISHRREGSCFGPGAAWELARIITPCDHISIIKSIQTELTFEDNTLRWPRGDSGWHTRTLGVGIGEVDISWCIKLESLSAANIENPYQFRQQGILVLANWLNEIPGIIHPEIAPWNEMLFLWGTDHYVRLRCPSNSIVSLWVFQRAPALGGGVLSAAGMLKAQTQIVNSDRTWANISEMD
jgi:hypothetical protein